MQQRKQQLVWSRQHVRAGERVAVAVSGGADSTALLLAMAAAREDMGMVLSAAHVHHGLRGAAADEDERFLVELTARLHLPLRIERGDAAAMAAQRGQGIEEAARWLRYGVFHAMLAAGAVDAVATAHTQNDQAETVLMKLLRGAWTEGLSGIAPVITTRGGRIIRPLLAVTRAEVVAYLEAAGQSWREDATNRDMAFTRNRIRHTLMPQLAAFQPNITEQLARMATVAGDEEAWWERELGRVLPGLLLPGKPVRGGGRASSTQPGAQVLAMELERLRALEPALCRRVLRAAAQQMGAALSFDQTESLLDLSRRETSQSRRGVVELGDGLVAERSARELRLSRRDLPTAGKGTPLPEIVVPVPGTLEAVDYGLRVVARGELAAGVLLLRTPRPGDAVRLPHSRSVKTVKEVLERRGAAAAKRAAWPVLAVGTRIVWMRDVEVERHTGLDVVVEPLPSADLRLEAATAGAAAST